MSRWGALFCLLWVGCTSAEVGDSGIDLTVSYDSTMGVDRLVVQIVERSFEQTIVPPLSLDPPGLRTLEAAVAVTTEQETETVLLRVDGQDPEGQTVGSGAVEVMLTRDRRVPAVVTLGAPILCGDARKSPALEGCDDGNTVSGDGCSATCVVEDGFDCVGSPSVCGRCGDGTAQNGEQCDDGNQIDGDGCSAACVLEPVDARVFELELTETVTSSSVEYVTAGTLTFEPNRPSERWVVFASGTLGSTSEAQLTAELRLLLNGEEVDSLGHQNMGGEDSSAGFVTFHSVADQQGPQVLEAQIRAAEGTTLLNDLRLVAMLLPPGADFQYVHRPEVDEQTGTDLELLDLSFTPQSAGEYLIFAKSSFTESPSPDTSQTWFVDDDGVELIRFSSSRDAWLPMFTAIAKPLDLSPKQFALRGASSDSSSNVDWYDQRLPYRMPVVPPMVAGSIQSEPVAVTFDHATQVEAGLAEPDGSDFILVVHGPNGPQAIDRVLDEDSEWGRPDTTVWFRPVLAPTAPEHYFYFGAGAALMVPQNPDAVFLFFDTFAGNQLDPQKWTTQRLQPTVTNGQLVLEAGQGVATGNGLQLGPRSAVEARVTVVSPPVQQELAILSLGEGNELEQFGFFMGPQGLVARAGIEIQPLQEDLSQGARLSLVMGGQTLDFYVNGVVKAQLVGLGLSGAGGEVRMLNDSMTAVVAYDWVTIREGGGIGQIGPVETLPGPTPSQWKHQKIMAFRADVFSQTYLTQNEEEWSTFEADPIWMVEMETETPAAPTEEILVAALRVSGESSMVGRKTGLVVDGDLTLIETAHRITRDSAPTSGYHHVAGLVDARTAVEGARLAAGIASLDGIRVDGARASLFVLRYPPR